jgi:hypothetical protein
MCLDPWKSNGDPELKQNTNIPHPLGPYCLIIMLDNNVPLITFQGVKTMEIENKNYLLREYRHWSEAEKERQCLSPLMLYQGFPAHSFDPPQ